MDVVYCLDKNLPKVSIAYCLDTLGVENGRHFGKFVQKWVQCTLGVENFDQLARPPMVKEIEAFLCFRIILKNSKIQNGRHF